MLKRLIFSLVLGLALLPAAVSAVTVTTDLQGELIKASQPTVYFYGEDGKRYVFPNEKIFYTWYSDFTSVRTVTDEELAAIQIGGNVTYRPGTKLLKVTTDPKVYAVSGAGRLRWLASEQLATALYGEDWAKQVQDIPDAFFQDYVVGEPVVNAATYEPAAERSAYQTISHVLAASSAEETSAPSAPSTSTERTITLVSTGGKNVAWRDSAVSSMGYKLVWSKNASPTYPTRDGDSYVYYGESSVKTGAISGDLESGVAYHVRVCEYLGGKCGVYSNEITITGTDQVSSSSGSGEETSSNATHSIVLTSTGGKNVSWTDTAVSSMGYKLVWSKNANPTYPTRDGDSYAYYAESSTKSGSISSVDAGATYHVRVCEYLGGKCGAYSNEITIAIPSESSNSETADSSSSSSSHTIMLVSAGGNNVGWRDTAVSSMGYKLVWSKNANPTYPTRDGDSYAYYAESSTKSGSISSVDAGATYHVRVCEYLGGKCGAYSNEITITAGSAE